MAYESTTYKLVQSWRNLSQKLGFMKLFENFFDLF